MFHVDIIHSRLHPFTFHDFEENIFVVFFWLLVLPLPEKRWRLIKFYQFTRNIYSLIYSLSCRIQIPVHNVLKLCGIYCGDSHRYSKTNAKIYLSFLFWNGHACFNGGWTGAVGIGLSNPYFVTLSRWWKQQWCCNDRKQK